MIDVEDISPRLRSFQHQALELAWSKVKTLPRHQSIKIECKDRTELDSVYRSLVHRRKREVVPEIKVTKRTVQLQIFLSRKNYAYKVKQ